MLASLLATRRPASKLRTARESFALPTDSRPANSTFCDADGQCMFVPNELTSGSKTSGVRCGSDSECGTRSELSADKSSPDVCDIVQNEDYKRCTYTRLPGEYCTVDRACKVGLFQLDPDNSLDIALPPNQGAEGL